MQVRNRSGSRPEGIDNSTNILQGRQTWRDSKPSARFAVESRVVFSDDLASSFDEADLDHAGRPPFVQPIRIIRGDTACFCAGAAAP